MLGIGCSRIFFYGYNSAKLADFYRKWQPYIEFGKLQILPDDEKIYFKILNSNFVLNVVFVTEATLRLALGQGLPVLSQADSDNLYRFQPNQKIYRFGKNIEYNQYSQRSEPITIEKPQGKLRILMVGDSVLNGGNFIDQNQIISELFEKKLIASAHPAEVLNASAGSWGIGNQRRISS
ncbi:hypothetical protein [Calothrix sp. CCY 0018]|uniref:hypothetical protein n=1 Tax=Calothrix sp. CCY 0018 TaxID=3103864 RepID=UPI0039C6820A